MTIREAAESLRARRFSAVELTASAIARIERYNPKLNAFITVTAERAIERARQADSELAAGRDRGPLHGVPIAVKDLFATRGVRTTAGSRVYENYLPSADATVVEKLEAAGAVNLGKLNLHELAYGITSANPHFGAAVSRVRRSHRTRWQESEPFPGQVVQNLLPLAVGTRRRRARYGRLGRASSYLCADATRRMSEWHRVLAVLGG